MIKILENFCNNSNRKKGLLLVDLPTGMGKTYAVAKYIANNYDKIKGKIFFVTQLKKNLPEADLRRCFKDIGKENEIDNVMLRVENNVDNLCNNFELVKQELYEYIGDKLLLYKIDKEIKLIKNKNVSDENLFLVQQAREDLQNETEKKLRDKVTAYLTFDKDGKEREKSEKIRLIKEDNAFQWISKLYPTVETYDKRIFIMSLEKFLYRYSTIIEPSFNIYESELMRNSVIFIDEFDTTKEVVLKKIIKDGLDNQLGIIELFREICIGLETPVFTKILTQETQRLKEKKRLKKSEEILSGLKERAAKIYDKYNFKFQFKLREEFKEGTKFLFQDYITQTVINGKESSLDLEVDTANQVNWLKVYDLKNKKSNTITTGNGNEEKSIYSLITEVHGFLYYFQTGVGFIAHNYIDLKRERGKDIYNGSWESAIRTVLSEFGLEGRYQNYLTSNILSSAGRSNYDWSKVEDQLDLSVYEKGFRYYQIIDNENHDTMSKLNYVAFNDSPEKFLCKLINRAKVVGISATATLPTVLANYDIGYIKRRYKDLVVELRVEDKQRLKDQFDLYIEHYDKVNIICEQLGNGNYLSKEAKEQYEDVASKIDSPYLKQRLLCFAEAVEFFCSPDCNLSSFLYFANTKGREYFVDSESQIKKLFDKLESKHVKSARIMFLHGGTEQFEKTKEEISERLKNNENIFVVTTYATMGAGQNIHYEYNKEFLANLIQINDLDYNSENKDFDAIYLETPSHILVNTINKFESDEDFVKFIYQMKFLEEAGEYSHKEIRSKVRLAFIRRVSDEGYDIVGRKGKPNYLFAYARIAQQAIGRICRTKNKNKNIYIFYQKGLEDKIKPISSYYDDKPINPEFRSFLDSCVKLSETSSDNKKYLDLQQLAATKDFRAKQYKDRIRANWIPENIDRWERIRDELLKNPTIDHIENARFPELYIELPEPDNKYYLINNEYSKEHPELPLYSFNKGYEYDLINEGSALLPEIIRIPGVKDYFLKNGYAIHFKKGKYILANSMIKQVYQGALGEVVGRLILKNKILSLMNLKFDDLPADIYELFDNKIDDIFFDFKNWSGIRNPNYDEEIIKIRKKFDKAKARNLIIVNLLKPPFGVKPYLDTIDGALLVLPYLYDLGTNKWNEDGMKKLYQILIDKDFK